jgi:hypothetical protein
LQAQGQQSLLGRDYALGPLSFSELAVQIDVGKGSHVSPRRGSLLAICADAEAKSKPTTIVLADDHTIGGSSLHMLLNAKPGFEVVAEAVRAAARGERYVNLPPGAEIASQPDD